MSDHPPVESHADFVNVAHDDIREATFNSEAWAESQEASTHEGTPTGVYWSPVRPGWRRDWCEFKAPRARGQRALQRCRFIRDSGGHFVTEASIGKTKPDVQQRIQYWNP